MTNPPTTAVIVGGGVAGTSCAVHLSALHPTARIVLVDPHPSLKICHALTHLSHTVLDTTVLETEATQWCQQHNITFCRARATSLDKDHVVHLHDNRRLHFDVCCIATGARPFIPPPLQNPRFAKFVLTLRDTDSVQRLTQRLASCRRLLVVGAGGIGMEVVHEIDGCHVIWLTKSSHIGGAFFDQTTAKAIQTLQSTTIPSTQPSSAPPKTLPNNATYAAAAVGPDWLGRREGPILMHSDKSPSSPDLHRARRLHGASSTRNIQTWTNCEVRALHPDPNGYWNVVVETTNNSSVGCDAILVGAGVVPNAGWASSANVTLYNDPDTDSEGAAIVAPGVMHTSVPAVFAAGDCTHMVAEDAATDWVQLRTWGQALAGGRAAASSMAQYLGHDDVGIGLEFEVFAHATRFFGRRVVLLGRWNAQGLDDGFKVLERLDDTEFVRVVIQNGRVRGAILVGDVDNAEIFENLIAGQMNIDWLGEKLVDKDIELDHYFD